MEKNKPTTIRELLKKEVKDFMYVLQERANTIPPNLLLNEVVNYAYDRCEEIDKTSFTSHNTELVSKIEGMKVPQTEGSQGYAIGFNIAIDSVINLINQEK